MVFRSSLFAAACAALLGSARAGNPATLTGKDELCSLTPKSYATAKQANPELSFAIDEVSQHSIATWYTDRDANADAIAQEIVATCPESKRMSVVVYGLPNKDCEAGYSASNSRVQSTADYIYFLRKLMDTVGDRKVLYVLEPDAVGLLAKEGGCGEAAGYRDNLKLAIQMLSENPNAEIYLDVGYWSLAYAEPRQRVVEVVKNLISGGGRVKGITLNTSNYRKTEEIADLCTMFHNDMSSTAQMSCVIDTSRNYRGSPSSEWCNVGSAGIGKPPTSQTGISNIDYFLWIKPPGESDGTCDGSGHTSDATRGPAAGDFFVDGFKKLWDYGFFVDSKNMAKFGDGSAPTPDPTSIYQSGMPPTQEPTSTTPAPVPEVTTSTPVTSVPETTTSAPESTTSAPESTTSAPETTTSAPETTTASPVATTAAPEATTTTPTTTTPSPVLDSTPSPSTTPAPVATTVTPGSGATDVPSATPVVTKAPDSSSSGSSIGSPSVGVPTTRPSFRPSRKPKTPVPTTAEPTETPSPAEDIKQSATPVADAGPSTIANNPNQATTKSSQGGSSATGGIIAAVLVAAVALAVAAAVFIHIRRRAQDAAADDMKTPTTLDPAHPAYLSQL